MSNYYVSTTGNNSNNGTSKSTPLLTLAAALVKVNGSATSLATADFIYIEKGHYNVTSGNLSIAKPVNIIGGCDFTQTVITTNQNSILSDQITNYRSGTNAVNNTSVFKVASNSASPVYGFIVSSSHVSIDHIYIYDGVSATNNSSSTLLKVTPSGSNIVLNNINLSYVVFETNLTSSKYSNVKCIDFNGVINSSISYCFIPAGRNYSLALVGVHDTVVQNCIFGDLSLTTSSPANVFFQKTAVTTFLNSDNSAYDLICRGIVMSNNTLSGYYSIECDYLSTWKPKIGNLGILGVDYDILIDSNVNYQMYCSTSGSVNTSSAGSYGAVYFTNNYTNMYNNSELYYLSLPSGVIKTAVGALLSTMVIKNCLTQNYWYIYKSAYNNFTTSFTETLASAKAGQIIKVVNSASVSGTVPAGIVVIDSSNIKITSGLTYTTESGSNYVNSYLLYNDGTPIDINDSNANLYNDSTTVISAVAHNVVSQNNATTIIDNYFTKTQNSISASSAILNLLSLFRTHLDNITLFPTTVHQQVFVNALTNSFDKTLVPSGSSFYSTSYLSSVVSGTQDKNTSVWAPTYSSITQMSYPITGGGNAVINVSATSTFTLTDANGDGYYFMIPNSGRLILIDGLSNSLTFIKYNNNVYKINNDNTATIIDNSSAYSYNIATITLRLKGLGSIALDSISPFACIVEGTTILTPDGVKNVETLKKGDLIVTSDNRHVQIVELLKTKIEKSNDNTTPYLVKKNAIRPNCPPEDLTISGPHAIQIDADTWEIPEEAYKRNSNIVRLPLKSAFVYYHIMLPDYGTDYFIANGQSVEGYGGKGWMVNYQWNEMKNGYSRHVTKK